MSKEPQTAGGRRAGRVAGLLPRQPRAGPAVVGRRPRTARLRDAQVEGDLDEQVDHLQHGEDGKAEPETDHSAHVGTQVGELHATGQTKTFRRRVERGKNNHCIEESSEILVALII